MSTWQPIETAPQDGTAVLVWDREELLIAWWAGLAWLYGPDMKTCFPTHWQPLPAPPGSPTP
jgi:hypothetical protein